MERALHGQKTDWIMHEYHLDDDDSDQVVCRVFKKKNHNRGNFEAGLGQEDNLAHIRNVASFAQLEARHNFLQASYDYSFDASINLPQLFSPESATVASSFISPLFLNSMDLESS
ncbi:NAC domain transcriptional regulator superfamily protein isoform 2 [Gossypium australe]|uniref:NAC domain transcriptional regulator superfamily protein isoform 2 n=1 Tax=Gossypium australe TaxID=47621 RepID=A0A5B6VDZ9_9ROSI|nr:NAC domain transcriptional regulator superfamily protein isoform 2 [Gossypium australe]